MPPARSGYRRGFNTAVWVSGEGLSHLLADPRELWKEAPVEELHLEGESIPNAVMSSPTG